MGRRAVLMTFLASTLVAVAAAQPGSEKGWITGRVVEGGIGAPDVEVRLEPVLDPYRRGRLHLEGKTSAEAEARTRTDAAGLFRLQIPELGLWKVVVEAEGRLRMERHLPPGQPDADLGTLELEKPAEVEIEALSADVRVRPQRSRYGSLKVVDEHRRPVAGALVLDRRERLPLAFTDEAGVARLAGAAGEEVEVEVLAADGHFGRTTVSFEEEAGGGLELQLRSPTIVSGRVVEVGSGDPIAGALVWPFPWGSPTRADEQGRWRLTLPAGEGAMLQATARGYDVGRSGWHRSTAAPAHVELRLSPVAAVSGRVLDGGGAPVAGAELRVFGRKAATGRVHALRRNEKDLSSRDGGYRLWGLAPGEEHVLAFLKHGYAPELVEIEAPVAFEERTGLEVTLGAGRVGLGRVIAADGDLPIAGAQARLEPVGSQEDLRGASLHWLLSGEEAPAGESDDDGLLRIPRLAAGRYDLVVQAEGFAPIRLPGLRIESGTGVTELGTVALARGLDVEGRVVDPEQEPIAGAALRIGSSSGEVFSSDADGRFRLPDRREGETLRLEVRAEGYGAEDVSAQVRAGGAPLEVVLQPAGRLRGRVLDTAGEPIEGAFVTYRKGGRLWSSLSKTSSDEGGCFLLENVPAGVVTLSVGASGYQGSVLRGIELPPGEEVGEFEVVLERGAALKGTVRDARGEPVAAVEVHVFHLHEGSVSGSRSMDAQADGSYAFGGLEPGPIRIEARHDLRGRVAESLELVPGNQTVDLTFEAGFDVAGRVMDAEGTPVSGAELALQPSDPKSPFRSRFLKPAARSGPDGSFTISGVEPGRHRLAARKKGFANSWQEAGEVEVGGEAVLGLEVVLRGGAVLHGRVLGLDAGELAGTEVTISDRSSGGTTAAVDAEGCYRLEGVTPGEWRVHARRSDGRSTATVEVTLEDGDVERELDLVFEKGFTLSGEVLGSGRPLAGVRVAVGGLGGGPSGAAHTDSRGRFRIQDLPAGAYGLAFESKEGLRHERQVVVEEDHSLRIELELGMVRGTVRDTVDGSLLSDVRLHLEARSSSLYRGSETTDSTGYFSFRQVPAGSWRLRARAPGYVPLETKVEVEVGTDTEPLELRLEPTEGITFEAILQSGIVPRDLRVFVFDAAGESVSSGSYSSVEGRFRVGSLAPGAYTLWLTSEASAPRRLDVVSPGDAGRVVLPMGGSLRVVVQELIGDPGIARVILEPPVGSGLEQLPFRASGFRSARLREGGEATFDQLSAGFWKVRAQHQDGRVWHAEATVVAGAMTEVRAERE